MALLTRGLAVLFGLVVLALPGRAAAQACLDAPSGLVSWYPAENTADDLVGGNHGVLQNGATFAPGKVGRAFSLDGTDDFVQDASPVGLPLGNAPRTMMLWFRTPRDLSTSTEAALVQYGTVTDGTMFSLITSANAPGKLYFYGNGFPGVDLPGTTTILPDTWYHGAVTYDGATVILYVNGESEASAPRSLNTILSVDGLTIGLRPNTSARWQGELDEVMIFDRALSAAEVKAVHDAGAAGLCRLDHFLCYKAKDSAGNICAANADANAGQACDEEADCGGDEDVTEFCVPNVLGKGVAATVTDQFQSSVQDVKKPLALCTPAMKNAEPVLDEDTHLKAYQIKLVAGAHQRRTGLTVTNQFGTVRVDTVKPERLLVPAAKSLTGPVDAPDGSSHAVDHYACYKIKVTAGTPKFEPILGVGVDGQFTTGLKLFDLKKPTRLCVSADKNGELRKQPATHLLCYQAKAAAGQPSFVRARGIFANDQFGPERLDTIKEEEFCVPSSMAP